MYNLGDMVTLKAVNEISKNNEYKLRPNSVMHEEHVEVVMLKEDFKLFDNCATCQIIEINDKRVLRCDGTIDEYTYYVLLVKDYNTILPMIFADMFEPYK